ncbi:MAG TPA: hypothetical protein VHJ34_06280, partial [Actinomycetota bacterium]|nr:hypothetical protein [Actinomycetota bacterium]
MLRRALGGRSAFAALALAAGALAPAIGPAAPACAGEGPRAALVVDTGSSVQTYCVALPAASVTGLDLVVAAGEQHGLDYAFGYGGRAVCRLTGIGSGGGECFEDDYPNFWAYWRGTGDGGWAWSTTGPHATVVEDGDVEGWAWGSGTGPDTHPAPPASTHDAVCPPVDDGDDDGGGGGDDDGGDGPPAPGGGAPAPTPDDATPAPQSTATEAAPEAAAVDSGRPRVAAADGARDDDASARAPVDGAVAHGELG